MPAGPIGYGVAMVHSKPSQAGPVALPKALAGQPFTAMAVSAEPLGSAVLAGCRGKTVYLMPQSHSGQVITASLQAPCMSLSWDEQGNLWIATKMQVYEIPGVGGEPSAHPPLTLVLDPQLGKASIQSLWVAPDGVRVAMIIRNGATSKIRIAAISRNRQYTYIAQTSSVLRVGTDIADPIALTWLDPDHLLVLGRTGSGRTQLYEVPLNGGQSTPIATPRGVTVCDRELASQAASAVHRGRDRADRYIPGGDTDVDIRLADPGLAAGGQGPDWLAGPRVHLDSGLSWLRAVAVSPRIGLRTDKREATLVLTLGPHPATVIVWHPSGSVVAPGTPSR